MVSFCANPMCSAEFRYLSCGQLFVIKTSIRRAETYWLCEDCSKEFRVQLEEDVVACVPLSNKAMAS